MDAAAGHMILQCVFDGSLSMSDTDIERRPYHRKCGCELHKTKGTRPTTCFRHRNVPLPKKQSWSDCSIYITTSTNSTKPSFVSDLSGRKKENDEKLSIR